MATYSVTSTAQTVAAAGSMSNFVHSAGTANVFLEQSRLSRVEVLRPGGQVSLLAGDPITARTLTGTATLDVTAYVSPEAADGILTPAELAAHPALAGAFVQLARVADLTYPLVISHRGGANVFPENTMEAYEGSAALGCKAIEAGDLHLLTDGGLGCMHDDTVDRTTGGTGNAIAFNTPAWKNLKVKGATLLGGLWGDVGCPTFTDVLDRLGGRVVLVPQAKSTGAAPGTAAAIVATVVARKLQSSVIISTISTSDFATITGAGIACMFVDTDGLTQTPAQLASAGVQFLTVSTGSVSAGTITAMHAAGIKVIGYTPDTQFDAAAFLALGGDGYFTNEPLYAAGPVNGYSYLRTSVPMQGVYDHGMLGDRATISTSPMGFGWSDTSGTTARSMGLGSISPVGGAVDPGTYTLEFDYTWTSSADNTRWIGAFLCCSNDKPLHGASGGSGNSGYRCLIGPSGRMIVSKVLADVITANLIDTTFSTITLPGTITLRATVTPTDITWTDVTNNHSVVVTDSAIRGRYVRLATSGSVAVCTRAARTA